LDKTNGGKFSIVITHIYLFAIVHDRPIGILRYLSALLPGENTITFFYGALEKLYLLHCPLSLLPRERIGVLFCDTNTGEICLLNRLPPI
jgi:hypothetical protein